MGLSALAIFESGGVGAEVFLRVCFVECQIAGRRIPFCNTGRNFIRVLVTIAAGLVLGTAAVFDFWHGNYGHEFIECGAACVLAWKLNR